MQQWSWYLGLDVGVVVVLQQQRGRLGVVFAGGDVQRGQTDLPFGVVLQQQRHHLIVALLQSDRQRGEAVLGPNTDQVTSTLTTVTSICPR